MVDGGLGDKSKSINIDPLPESDIFHHGMRFHFTLHLNVKDLKCSSRQKWTQNKENKSLEDVRNNFKKNARREKPTKKVAKGLYMRHDYAVLFISMLKI